MTPFTKIFQSGLKRATAVLASGLICTGAIAETNTCLPSKDSSGAHNGIRDALYSLGKPQDALGCAMTVQNGRLVVSGPTTNPGMTCPDMVGWKLFAEAIQNEFWKNWASDGQTWPQNPLPLCPASATSPTPNTPPGSSGGACCTPGATGNPSDQCPVFPGDQPGKATIRVGQPLSKAHATLFTPEAARAANLAVATAEPDPGRKIRQAMAEVVFRNKPMLDYVFSSGLYYQEGLQALFKRVSDYVNASPQLVPYYPENTPGALMSIDFPVDSVMIKSNWIDRDYAIKLGMKDDKDNPYITMTMKSASSNGNPAPHWLVAFHITPNWVWTTFEHVNNLGRCDYTGCNDSYGYTTPDTVATNQAKNYTMPAMVCDNLPDGNWVYDTNKPYAGGKIRPALATVLAGLKIGTDPGTGSGDPTPGNMAWKSYRLKGTQTEFVTAMGQTTRLGNSVTEGGFVNSSSCITCHARASTAAYGTIPPALSVFVSEAAETGYQRSANGIPNPSWYARDQQPASPLAIQTDFVWGFLAAQCTNGLVPSLAGCVAPKANANALTAPAPRAPFSIRNIVRE